MTDIELDRIVTLKQAAELMGVSIQTLRRTHRDKFIRLSPRRLGMRMRDALFLGKQLGSNVVEFSDRSWKQ